MKMSFYQYFTFKTSGDTLNSAADFTSSATSTQFEKNTGEVYTKVSNGIYDKTSRKIISRAEMDLRYAMLVGQNTFTGHQLTSVDNTYNIGSASKKFANVYAYTFQGNATSANYADLAEKYLTDTAYPVGTVLEIGGEKEATLFNGGALAGVISDKPGLMLNSEADGQYIALKGRVPVLCQGDIKKGQFCLAVQGGKVKGVDKSDIENDLDIVGVALEDSKDGSVEVLI
jgi:hypothetical protein